MPELPSVGLCPLISSEQVENAFWTAVRMFVGRGKAHRADDVAQGSRINRKTLDAYRGYPIGHPDWRPLDNGQKWSIASYCGAELTTKWLSLIDQAAYDLPDIEPDPGELAADTSEDAAKVVRMAADRDLSNDDPHQLRATGARMMRTGAHLLAVAR